MILKFNEPAVQAAIIVAIVTLVTVILGLIFKDYFIPGWVESRSRKRKGQELLHQYRVNLFNSCETLLSRLGEIYRVRSHYLWAEAPQNEFYNYKYKSSVFRLCVLLGWIRAYRLQEALLSFRDKQTRYTLSQAMDAVGSALADGQEIEMYVTKAICSILGIDSDAVPKDALMKFSVQIDELVQKYTMDSDVNSISELPVEVAEAFVVDLMQLVTFRAEVLITGPQKQEIIREVSVRLGLIYRDWQQAIGDVMVGKNEPDGSSCRVIGYRQFEEIWDGSADGEGKRWIGRAERIFQGLDLRADHRTDSRIAQLRRVYTQVYKLRQELYEMEGSSKPTTPSKFRKILPEV